MVRAHYQSRVHVASKIEPLPYRDFLKGPLKGTSFKAQAMRAAIELGYSKETIEKIEAAETDAEINRIMITARKEKYND